MRTQLSRKFCLVQGVAYLVLAVAIGVLRRGISLLYYHEEKLMSRLMMMQCILS